MDFNCNDLLGVSVVIWQNISLYSLVLLLPTVLFLLFLLYKLRSSLQILRETADVRTFRASALAFLWLVCIVNMARMIIQVLVPYDNQEWKVLWVATRFGDTWLQISIIIFLSLLLAKDVPVERILGGVGRMDSTIKMVLWETNIIAILLTFVESSIQAVLIFVLRLPIYDTDEGEYSTYWLARSTLYVIVYSILLVCHYVSSSNSQFTSNMLSLNDRPEKFGVTKLITIYLVLMLLVTLLNLLAWVLLFFNLDAGVCFVGFDLFVYFSLYPPLVYLIFMAKFFETAEHWPLKNKKLLKQQQRQRLAQREQERQRREKERQVKTGEGATAKDNSWQMSGAPVNGQQ